MTARRSQETREAQALLAPDNASPSNHSLALARSLALQFSIARPSRIHREALVALLHPVREDMKRFSSTAASCSPFLVTVRRFLMAPDTGHAVPV